MANTTRERSKQLLPVNVERFVGTGARVVTPCQRFVVRRFNGSPFLARVTATLPHATRNQLARRRHLESLQLENLALRGALGLSLLSLSDSARPDEPSQAAFGAGYTLAVSYDWFFHKYAPSGGWSVVPVFALRYIPSDPLDGFVGFLGLEISYWSGLPTNQLELPPGEGY